MRAAQLMSLNDLEGQRVGIARYDGTRLDDCALLGVFGAARTVWVDVNGRELILPFDDVADLWELRPQGTLKRAYR